MSPSSLDRPAWGVLSFTDVFKSQFWFVHFLCCLRLCPVRLVGWTLARAPALAGRDARASAAVAGASGYMPRATQLADAQLPPLPSPSPTAGFLPGTQLEFGPFPVATVGPGCPWVTVEQAHLSRACVTASFHQTQSRGPAAGPWNPPPLASVDEWCPSGVETCHFGRRAWRSEQCWARACAGRPCCALRQRVSRRRDTDPPSLPAPGLPRVPCHIHGGPIPSRSERPPRGQVGAGPPRPAAVATS